MWFHSSARRSRFAGTVSGTLLLLVATICTAGAVPATTHAGSAGMAHGEHAAAAHDEARWSRVHELDAHCAQFVCCDVAAKDAARKVQAGVDDPIAGTVPVALDVACSATVRDSRPSEALPGGSSVVQPPLRC